MTSWSVGCSTKAVSRSSSAATSCPCSATIAIRRGNDDLAARLRVQERNRLGVGGIVGVVVAGRGMQDGGGLLAGGALVLLCVGQIVDWRGVLRGKST